MIKKVENIVKEFESEAIQANFTDFMNFIESYLTNAGVENTTTMKILTACEEIIVNVLNYSYTNDSGKLKIDLECSSETVKITFIDSGMPFNPLEKPDADTGLNLKQREIGGLGILMVKKMMDDVLYEYKERQNHLTIIKYL